jgi:DNA mismatch repair ATPase MutS
MLPAEGLPASKQIARLHRLVELADSRKNMMFAPVAGVLLWGTQLAFAIEEWRRRSGPIVARWLAATGELEALSALAGYAYENPSDVFPEVLPEGGPVFEARGIAHPLIPEQRCVRNDVSLNADVRLLVVSGSNMSGKSTLLRTVGANAILALAGATVRARSLRLSPLAIGASIRIQDSLQAGSSRFYAEITRLRQIVDLTAGAIPVLFLLDELLHGTNSHDRRIGGEAVVKGLVRQGAIGLLTTHDLSLAHIAEALAPRARNVHFEDHIEGGRVAFDYRLRDGIVQKSNALELMRAVGLEV